MKLFKICFWICAFLPLPLVAAQVTVTGTVLDPNGNPYANGTASAYSLTNSGQVGTTTTPVGTTSSGFFSMVIPTNTYIFTICAPPTPLGPTANPTPTQICFTSQPIPITITGDISSQLNAVAAVLGPKGTGGGGAAVIGTPGTISTTPVGSQVQINATNPFNVGNVVSTGQGSFGNGANEISVLGFTPDPFGLCQYSFVASSGINQLCSIGDFLYWGPGLGQFNQHVLTYQDYPNIQNGYGTTWNPALNGGTGGWQVTTSPLCTFANCKQTTTASRNTNNFVVAAQAPLNIGTNIPAYSSSYISNGAGPPAWTTAGRKGGQGVYFGSAGKTKHADIVQVSCGGTATTFRNIGGIGVPTTSPNTGSCPGAGNTVTDGNIVWLQVGPISVNANNQTGVVDDFWNDVYAIHDASGNVLQCTFNIVMPYIGWNVIDQGVTAPNYQFGNLDSVLTTAINDPSFCPGSKLAMNLIPFSGSSANGGQNLPPYVVTQAWATIAANATQWQANTKYNWDYTISVPGGVTGCGTPCYEQVTSTGANSVFTSGGSQPTWTTGAPPQTTADGSGTWTSSSTAPAQKFTYCDGSGSTGIAWSLSGISNTLKSNLTVNGTTTIVATPAITAADAVTGILWPGDTTYAYALEQLYKATTQHYNAQQWANIWAYIRGGLTKDGQNLPICGGIWAGAGTAANANTGVSNANWNNLWVQASSNIVGYMGTLQTAGYSLQTSPQSNSNPSNATDPPALADGLSTFIATGGANGSATGVGLSWGGESEATDATALTQGTTGNGDWFRNTAQWYHAVPNVSIQMVTDTGGGAGCNTNGVGTLPQNVTFAAQFGIRMYEVLQPDFFRLDPVSPDFALCSQGSLAALTAFQNGQNFIQPQFPLFSGGAGPAVSTAGLINWNPPVQKSNITSAYTNATTTFSTVSLSPGIFIAANATEKVVCEGLWQNTGAAATSGPKFQWTGPASPTAVSADSFVVHTVSTVNDVGATAFSTSMADAGTITAQTNFKVTLILNVINGTTAGQLQLQAALNAASGSLTIQPGFTCQTN